MKHRIVITRHRPWLKPALIGGGSFALAVAAWALYAYTRAATVSDFERAQLEVEQLREERRALTRDLRAAREEIKRLEEQAVYVRRSQEIDGEACNAVRESLTQLQAEASDLREQLAFYRGIVAPEQSRAGVRVYEFKLAPGAAAGGIHYELVLIQSVRHDKRVAGRIELELVGQQDGAETRLPWAKITSDDGAANLVFSLKYFEEFAGDIRLPPGFQPTRVVVTLIPDGNGMPRVEESFDWVRVFNGGGT
ncbi:DUF6776 family protein [Fontimonas sp. SYSU GA230001]|uniref:DUF6776 family protein n=1 Tax=Fontimonas sp. SYSU GA230001 TaxID=3142450 RepID=UPI0032B3A809